MRDHQLFLGLTGAAAATAVVVNDDSTQLALLSGLVRKAGLDPQAFSGAEAALAAMDPAAPPTLVVTDLNMPGIDGWRFCRLLRSPEYAPFNQIPIVVVSATFSGDEPHRLAADLGVEAFVPYPVDGDLLIRQLKGVLGGRLEGIAPRVLIVHGSETLSRELQQAFAGEGYLVDAVATVRDAADALATSTYAMVVMSQSLPDGPGDALLDECRSQDSGCARIMITSEADPHLAVDWMKRGAAAYVSEPFDPEYLLELCHRARRERTLLRTVNLLDQRTRELLASQQRYREIFEGSRDGFVMMDPHGHILDANRAYCRMLGYSLEELRALDSPYQITPQHWHGWEQEEIWEKRLLREGHSGVWHKEYIRKDGTIFPVELEAFTVRKNDGETAYLWAVVRDITERKREEGERRRLQAQLTQAQRMESVGRLAGGVAHDFNNMLGVILGHAEMALERVDPSHPLFSDLRDIRNAAKSSAELTQKLLTFARKQVVSPKVINLNETVVETLTMLRRLIGENIDLAWVPANDLASVKVDPSQVSQVLANLCVNARDAIAHSGTITIETRNVTFDQRFCAGRPGSVPGEYVLLSVRDDGCGMDDETLSRLFEPFFTTKEPGRGTGLGLSTVYGTVKQNKGFVYVDSELGQGTTIRIYLPRHEATAPSTPERGPHGPPPSGHETILLVEDEPAILKVTKMMLERLGYRVLAASTPGEAVRLAREEAGEIHLLLTDVVMPEMNGRDLAENLLSHHPDLKQLFMSGYTADILAHHGVLAEGVHYIQKPFNKDVLAEKIRSVVDGA